MANSNLRTRVEQLERRQTPQGAVDRIVIVDMGDLEERPQLFWCHGRSYFEAVPEGATREDLERIYR